MQMELKFCRETLRPYIKDIFKQLHSIPEVSWQEIKTTAFLKERLEELGYKTVIFSDCTGVVGIRGQGPLTVALRADMDAICHSRGMDRRVIHSCGHDAHMAMVLTAACALQDLSLPDNVKVKILFQPAEEKGEGALRLIEKGVVDDLDFLFGVHLRPIQELPGGKATPAIQHGAAEPIYGVIKGVSAHGARPHLGINSIEIAASLVQLLQSMHLDPLIPSSVKMTRLIAGSENGNVIPGYAQFTLDLRAQTNQQMKNLVQKVEQVNPLPYTALGFSVTDIVEKINSLTAKGVVFERYEFLQQDDLGIWTTPDGARIAWCKDPDGNVVSLTEAH